MCSGNQRSIPNIHAIYHFPPYPRPHRLQNFLAHPRAIVKFGRTHQIVTIALCPLLGLSLFTRQTAEFACLQNIFEFRRALPLSRLTQT
jgi:hypothetical protein